MKKGIISLVVVVIGMFCVGGLQCFSQEFVDRYKTLTKDNLANFMDEWREYSVKQSANISYDKLITDILNRELSEAENTFKLQREGVFSFVDEDVSDEDVSDEDDELEEDDESEDSDFDIHNSVEKPQYCVVSLTVPYITFDCDADTIPYLGGYIETPDTATSITDSLKLFLPRDGLYLTDSINKKLSEFCGGLEVGDGYSKINEDNVALLRTYIPVSYGHWGGYWWFYTFPTITSITRYNNLICVDRRKSWYQGDEIWYAKRDNGYDRLGPRSVWME